MLLSLFDLLEHLNREGNVVAGLLLSAAVNKRLRKLYDNMHKD